ncbi:hypothetical protein BC832DRAFT_614973 [Gaertneriomyces semiglobifer]|nr:hypothetical protein BC832DRAFT_614973 [Gaertneriomyces semiglobifer]
MPEPDFLQRRGCRPAQEAAAPRNQASTPRCPLRGGTKPLLNQGFIDEKRLATAGLNASIKACCCCSVSGSGLPAKEDARRPPLNAGFVETAGKAGVGAAQQEDEKATDKFQSFENASTSLNLTQEEEKERR